MNGSRESGGRAAGRLAFHAKKMMTSVLSGVAKAKCMSTNIRSKTDALKARLLLAAGLAVLSMKKKKKLKCFSAKIIYGGADHDSDQEEKMNTSDDRATIVLYDNPHGSSTTHHDEYHDSKNYSNHQLSCVDGDEEEDNKYPDLRHSLFEEEEEEAAAMEELEDLLARDPNASSLAVMPSVMELVKDSNKNNDFNAESFNLEDEIDEVADLFITKFHKRMRLQKLLSFKRYQQMLERSAA